MKKHLLYIGLWLPLLAFSQNGEWARFQSLSQINDILSDPQFVWIATNTGVVRMDAQTYQKTYFNTENGLSGDKVFDLLRDSKGRIWAATEGGLSLWKENRWESQAIADNINERSAYSLTEDWKGRVWIGMTGQIAIYEEVSYSFFKYVYLDAPIKKLLAHNGSVWIVLDRGFWRLKEGIMEPQAPFLDSDITDIDVDVAGNVLVSCRPSSNSSISSLMKFEGEEWKPAELPLAYQEHIMYSLESGCRDKFLVGNLEAEIFEVSPQTFTQLTIVGLDSAYRPTSIYHDPYRNTIWMGTSSAWSLEGNEFYPAGLYEIKSSNIPARYHKLARNGLVNDDVIRKIIPGENGSMWIAKERQLYNYQKGNWQRWDFKTNIQTMAKDPLGRIWISTFGQTSLYMLEEQLLREVWVDNNGTLSQLERKIYKGLDFDGDSLFYVGANVSKVMTCRILRIESDKVIISKTEENLHPGVIDPTDHISVLKVTKNGNIWVAANGDRIFRFDGNQWFGPVHSGLGAISSITEAGDSIWFTGFPFSQRPGGLAYTSFADWPLINSINGLGCTTDASTIGSFFRHNKQYYFSTFLGFSISKDLRVCTQYQQPFDATHSINSKLVLDTEGNLWYHSYTELYVYNQRELINIVQHEGASPAPTSEPGTWPCVDPVNLDSWNIYPNPITFGCWIEKEFSTATSLKIRLLDFSGRSLHLWPEQAVDSGNFRQFLEMNVLESGNYFLQLITKEGSEVVKISLNMK